MRYSLNGNDFGDCSVPYSDTGFEVCLTLCFAYAWASSYILALLQCAQLPEFCTKRAGMSMQKYRNRVIAGVVLAILIYTVYLFVAETRADDSAILRIREFPVWLILPLIILQLFAAFFRWIEWHYYLGVVGARKKISVLDSVVIHVAGFTMAASPGKAGELMKSVALKANTGIEISKSAPVVLAERVVDGIAVILMVATAALLGGNTTGIQDWQRNS